VRITEVESFILHVPIPRFVADSFNQAATWGLPGVIVKTDEGLSGTGYTSTLSRGDDAIKDIIDRCYAPRLLDADPLLHQRIWEDLYWSDAHWVGRLGITQMALAAVDIALWDLRAKSFGVPLWRLVGGHKDGRVPSYNTDGGWLNFELPRLVEEMTAIVEAGWRGVKMKIGLPDPRKDVTRVQAVREALGPDVDLMIDVNGEHVYSRVAFRDFIARAGVGYVQADVTRLGGVTEWLAVAELALAHHVPVVPHHADMMRVHQHLGVGHPASPMIECIPWLQEIFEKPADIRAGVFYVDDEPGASTTFDEAAFRRFRVA
jgi:L-alanine-DL-glutamate epimerase-like enolase superfamily enzyme